MGSETPRDAPAVRAAELRPSGRATVFGLPRLGGLTTGTPGAKQLPRRRGRPTSAQPGSRMNIENRQAAGAAVILGPTGTEVEWIVLRLLNFNERGPVAFPASKLNEVA